MRATANEAWTAGRRLFGTALRRARRMRGWSLQRLSDETNGAISKQYLSFLENSSPQEGRSAVTPSKEKLDILSSVLQWDRSTMDEILGLANSGHGSISIGMPPEGLEMMEKVEEKLAAEQAAQNMVSPTELTKLRLEVQLLRQQLDIIQQLITKTDATGAYLHSGNKIANYGRRSMTARHKRTTRKIILHEPSPSIP